ncbi:MAG: DinB family protein [Pirellulaceae bacterium]
MNLSQRPGAHECFDFHCDYVAKVPDGDILQTLELQLASIPQTILEIEVSELEVVHPPYGWAVRTVLEHCCDAERVFGYRALRFATGDQTDLPGWDENHYATCGYARPVALEDLAEEFRALRASNLLLLRRLDDKCWNRLGTADGRKMSVRTIAWLMAGHWLHHAAILKKRLQA